MSEKRRDSRESVKFQEYEWDSRLMCENWDVCLSVYQISAFQCTKFQGNQIMLLCFTTTFTPWRKKTKPIFGSSYLRNTWHDLVKIWNVKWWCWPTFPPQKSFDFVKVSRSYVYVKIALLFFLLITHSVACRLLGPHDTLPCFLIFQLS